MGDRMNLPSGKLRARRHGGALVAVIDNPPANVWDADSLNALQSLVEQCEADRDLHAIVLVGQGEKFFSAGADLKLFADGDKQAARAMAERFGAAFEALASFRGLTIAAINGYAMGGGLECALACDLRIAEAHAQMGLPEASVGLLPCGGGTQNLAWTVGEAWAKRMILCGERLSAEQAARIGLVEEVVEAGQSLTRALALAERAGRQSPLALAACKRLIQQARSGSIAAAYQAERQAFVALFDTQDQKEGVNAFLEKRRPNWVNG